MKKIIAAVLMLMMICCMVTVYAADYSLPEKMQKQLEIGSGLKGSFLISSEGFDPEIPVFRALNNAEIQLRGLSSGDELHYYIYQADEKESQIAKTELYGKDAQLFFRSDCLPDTVITVPNMMQILNQIPHTSEGNPPFFSVAYQLAVQMNGQLKKEWDPVLQRYQNQIELWLARFPVETDYALGEDDRSLLNMTYTIPYRSMMSFVFELLPDLLKDGELMGLLNQAMDTDQKDLYLNESLLYFYRQVMEASTVDDDIILTKTSDTKTGQTVSQHLSLPLDQNATGFSMLQIDEETTEQIITFILQSPDRLIQLTIPSALSFQDSFEHEIVYRDVRMDADSEEKLSDNKSWLIHLTGQVSGAEISLDDGKTHENYEYFCEVKQDLNNLPEEIPKDMFTASDPLTLRLSVHFSSKNAQQSPTTAEINLEYQKGKERLRASGTFKSASPWLLTPFEHSGSVSLLTADEKQRESWLNEWARNAETILLHNGGTVSESSAESESENGLESEPSAEPEKQGDLIEKEEKAPINKVGPETENDGPERDETGEDESEPEESEYNTTETEEENEPAEDI